MARRMTPSQWNNMVRQTQQKQRQAIDKYNREVRAHNRKVKQAIDNYNREVRSYNTRARTDRQRLKNEIARLHRQVNTTHYVTFRVSVDAVQAAYEKLDNAAESGKYSERYNEILDLSEREAANNVELMNSLVEGDSSVKLNSDSIDSNLTPILKSIAPELGDRWQGHYIH